MIKGSERRKPAYPIDPLFVDRWSPRAMSSESIEVDALMTLFEAARWAPSSFNTQPWRMLYALRDTAQWPLFFDLLTDTNKAWASHGGALVLFVSKTHHDDGKPSITHVFDAGAAWQNFALQGWRSGLVVHGMQGFDYELARAALAIPDTYRIEMMAVVGRPGALDALSEYQRGREFPKDRRPIEHTVCEGAFRFPTG
jgi:nitroreductase